MAHFHRLPRGDRLSEQSITVTTPSVSIGLWGYLDFNRRELQVVSSSPIARVESRRIVGNSREWLVTPMGCDRVRLEARTVDGRVWDWVELTFASRATVIAQQRQAVITEAQRHVGAHYVWGAAGAKPGGNEGMSRRPGAVSLVADRLDAQNPCLKAASCSVDGYHVCAGRFRTLNGRVVQSNDAALRDYLDGLRGISTAQWKPMGGFWPRMMEGKTVTRQIVLGESCIGIRHFDCVGFINFCMEVALGRPVQDSIQGWINSSPEVTDGSDQPGDILTQGTGHIGFAMGNGRAIHASETARGVVIDQLNAGAWRRGRFLR